MSIKGVLFDLGGTLFDYSNDNASVALLGSAKKLAGNKPISPRDVGKAYVQASREISKEYAALPYYLHADLFRDMFTRMTTLLNFEFREEVYAEYRAFQHQSVVDGLQLKPECLEALQGLKDKGLYLAIVSNIDEDMLQPLVEREGLDQYLHHWTSSEAAQSCKPDKKIFEVSLDKANIAPEHLLFVGDSPEHDINGATPFGMKTALMDNGRGPAPLQSGAATLAPSHEIEKLTELLTLT